MHVLIVYATKHGATEEAACAFADCFEQAALRDLSDKNIRTDIDRYDAVIIGSAVYRGRMESTAINWLKKHEKALAKKRCGVFLCHAFLDEAPDIVERCLPEELVEQCVFGGSVGGVLPTEGVTLSERRWLKKHMQKKEGGDIDGFAPSLDMQGIRAMAKRL